MRAALYHSKLLLLRLGIVLLLFTLCRGLFYLFNFSYFEGFSFVDIGLTFLYGLRFDLSAIIYINLLFILLHLIPHPYQEARWYQRTLKVVFYIPNSIALFFAIADFEYFQYTFQRTTTAVFGISQDFFNLLPEFLKDFWYLFLILGALLALAEYLYRKTDPKIKLKTRQYALQIVLFFVAGGLFVVGARGGLQLKPITPLTASYFVNARLVPLVTNTPFTLLYSLGHKGIDKLDYYTPQQAERIYPVNHDYQPKDSFRKKNVVIIVLESFSKEYVGALNDSLKGYTPFLDKLAEKSLVFPNAFANGTRSIEAIPSICAGLPALMNDPFITSIYQNNTVKGLGTLLSKKGYTTSFFHGAEKGSMGLDGFAGAAGFDQYYAQNDFPDPSQSDGNWGIYDEPFFQFFAQKLAQQSEPFCALFFSLTSHHPFNIPEQYQDKIKAGPLPIHQTIRYTDHALMRFFETAKQMEWYDRTIFVITADHTAHSSRAKYYNTQIGRYRIPLLLFTPDSTLQGTNPKVVQQTDILPTILDYLNFSGKFVAFGESALDTTSIGRAVQYLSSVYQYIEGAYMLRHNGTQPLALFNYQADPLLKQDSLTILTEKAGRTERVLKAVLKNYHYRLRNNKLTPRVP